LGCRGQREENDYGRYYAPRLCEEFNSCDCHIVFFSIGEDTHRGNRLIAQNLIRAIETNTQPKGSMYDGRAALEMIMAVYESHRLNAPVTLPLNTRKHPLSLL